MLILAGSLNTGKTMLQAIDTILYYGGNVNGVCSIFSAASKVAGLDIHAAFTTADIPDYQVYPSHACPLCKAGVKVDAIVNSYAFYVNKLSYFTGRKEQWTRQWKGSKTYALIRTRKRASR